MSRFIATSIAFILAAVNVHQTECLSCYECSLRRPANGEPQNLTCLEAPWDIPGSVKTCLPHMRACRILRTENKGTGQIKFFLRSCSPIGEDHEEENLNDIIYHRFCFTSKCNKGDGIKNAEGEQNKKIVAILIKDIQSAGHRIPRRFLLPIFQMFVLIFSKTMLI